MISKTYDKVDIKISSHDVSDGLLYELANAVGVACSLLMKTDILPYMRLLPEDEFDGLRIVITHTVPSTES